MNPRPAGSFATLLMSGPLIAIPLMAVFGVPEFGSISSLSDRKPQTGHDSSMVASPRGEAVDSLMTGTSPTSPSSVAPMADPLDMPPRSPRARLLSPHAQPLDTTMPTSGPQRPGSVEFFDSWTHAGDQTSGSAQAVASVQTPPVQNPGAAEAETVPAEFVPQQQFPWSQSARAEVDAWNAEAAAGEASWQSAAQRLQELGIDDYRLERGVRSDTFLFICQFAPGPDPRIVRRFEAQADRPIDAVQAVLAQIENWRRRTDSSFVKSH